MDLNMLISFLKGRKRISRKFNCSIRIMGDKEDVYLIFNEIKNCFSTKNFKIYAREYVMYKDKKERDKIDTTRSRIYIRLAKIE